MLHALYYSLIRQVTDKVDELTNVVWVYNGVSLSDEENPFATIEAIETENKNLSKERLYYRENYHFRIGLFAKSNADLTKLSDKMKQALRQPKMTLYNTDKEEPEEDGYFYVDLQNETVITPEEIDEGSRKHRLYYDVEIIIQQTITEE